MMYLADISLVAFVATEFNEIFSGRQPCQDVKFHILTWLSVRMIHLTYLLDSAADTQDRKHSPLVWT